MSEPSEDRLSGDPPPAGIPRASFSAVLARVRTSGRGNAFLYLLVVMLIFGLLGSAVISMYTSAERMTKGVPHEARQARALAESSMRYAVSDLRNVGYRSTVINRLNTTAYTVDNAGTFDLNIFGKWFRSNENHTGSTDLKLDVPEGDIPSDFAIPANVFLLNLESARDALIFTGTWDDDFVGRIPTAPDMSTVPLSVALGDTLVADRDQLLLIAVQADGTYASDTPVVGGGTLKVAAEAADVFPERNSSFYIQSTLDEKRLYYYEALVDKTTHAELTNISEDLTVTGGDYVALSSKNHRILATGAAGSTAFGGTDALSMDFYRTSVPLRWSHRHPWIFPPTSPPIRCSRIWRRLWNRSRKRWMWISVPKRLPWAAAPPAPMARSGSAAPSPPAASMSALPATAASIPGSAPFSSSIITAPVTALPLP